MMRQDPYWNERTDNASGYGEGGGGRAERPAGPAPVSSTPSQQDALTAAIMEFIKYMSMPVDQLLASGDLQTKGIFNNTMAAASTEARNRGIGGPLAVNNTMHEVAGAMGNLQAQRSGLALQAMGLGDNRERGFAGLQEQARQFDAGLAQRQKEWAQQRADNQAMLGYGNGMSWGQGIGSVLGAAGGLTAGLLIPGAQPLIPQLMAGGAGVGGGLGGAIGGGVAYPRNGNYSGY